MSECIQGLNKALQDLKNAFPNFQMGLRRAHRGLVRSVGACTRPGAPGEAPAPMANLMYPWESFQNPPLPHVAKIAFLTNLVMPMICSLKVPAFAPCDLHDSLGFQNN